MSGKRAKQLREEARLASLDGSVVGSHEYRRLKRSYNNPHYAPVVVLYPSPPGLQFTGPYRLERMAKDSIKRDRFLERNSSRMLLPEIRKKTT